VSLLNKLKNAKKLNDFALLLGFRPNMLAYVLYKIPEGEKYVSFEIPKKDGGIRVINAPKDRLKNLQRRLTNILNSCIEELDKDNGQNTLAHGFKTGFSIHTNAKIHKNKRYVLNFDIEEFFPSINFGRVRGYFIKNKNFLLTEKVATIIAQICCHKNQLPQGSPCSPVISNLITHLLDIRLVGLAKKYGCAYSRYADDITFSTNQKDFPMELGAPNTDNPDSWILGEVIEKQVKRTGFKIKKSKTRLRYRDRRQVVTGLVVNQKVNVRREYYKLARAMTDKFFKTGEYEIPAQLSPLDVPEDEPTQTVESKIARLEGILNHIYYTRNFTDHRVLRDKQDKPTSIWCLYRDFIYYKHFGISDKPLVICEGVTDRIYLNLALKKLYEEYPDLIEKTNDKLQFKIRFLNYSKHVRELLHLTGGTGELARFAGCYSKMVKRFSMWSPTNPVIILTDNDKGGGKDKGGEKKSNKNGATVVFSAVYNSSSKKVRPSVESNDDFYFVNNNLYLVKTPHVGSKKETCIEDLFDQNLFSYEINGKTFNPENDANREMFYGKKYFAEKVIAKNFNTINFDNFKSLLNRLVAVIKNFNSLK
jgi:RNA-directed DNA polymerase